MPGAADVQQVAGTALAGGAGRLNLPLQNQHTVIAIGFGLDVGQGPCELEIGIGRTTTAGFLKLDQVVGRQDAGGGVGVDAQWEGNWTNLANQIVYIYGFVNNQTSAAVFVRLTAWMVPP